MKLQFSIKLFSPPIFKAPPSHPVTLLLVKLVFVIVVNPSQHQSAPPPKTISSLANNLLSFGFAELSSKTQSTNVQFEWCFTAPPDLSAVLLMKVALIIESEILFSKEYYD